MDREHLPKGIGTRDASRLQRGLELAGVRLPAQAGSRDPLTFAATKRIDVAAVASATAAAQQARKQVFDILVRGEALSVSLCTAAAGNDAAGPLAAACEVLARALRDAGASPAQLELVIEGDDFMPAQALAIRREGLGDGVVHVISSDSALYAGRDRRGAGHFWEQLWCCRGGGELRIAYAPRVTTPCPLLASEMTGAVLPLTHAQVPAGTAWLQFGVDLMRFVQDRNGLCEERLVRALRGCVQLGELLYDEIRWPTAEMQADAWTNRRLAIAIEGLGDLVQRQAMDPTAFSSLEYLGDLLKRVRRILWAQSRAIALRRSPVPAIDRTDPGRVLPGGAPCDAWRRRWADAVAAVAIRHRNLLALSPWSVFPSRIPADFRYADLLPVLRLADVCSLAGSRDIRHWNINVFKTFHRRARAALQQREATHQIAERC